MLSFLRLLLTGLLGVLWDGVTAFGGVRLVDGENKCSGRVEVLRHERWGTVCDHGWDLREADVVCLELGCGLAESALHGSVFGAGSGEIWLRHVQCSGHESSLTRCAVVLHNNVYCTHENNAGVKCSGTLLLPTLTLLSPHTVFSPGEAVRFGCSVLLGHHLSDFHLYKHGVSTPLVTQRADQTQARVELTLSDIETFHQGSYSCRYRIKGGFPSQLLSSPPSNSINITVVELLTPQHWYNTSSEAPAGSVMKGHNFNITCSTPQQYPGGSFQLRLIRSNGTVRQSLPALTPSVTFTFPNAQSSNEGYYYCLYRVQLGGRTFVSRESQPLPIAIRDPDPVLSPMVISWLVSGLTFVVAVVVWMFHSGSLLANMLGCLAWFCVDTSRGVDFGLSILWFILFTPCSFVCWYRPLYGAFRSDSSFRFFAFFFVYICQFGIYVIQCIGITGWGASGWISALTGLNRSIPVGIIMILIAALFTSQAVMSLIMFKKVHGMYRTTGASFAKAQQEFATGVMSNKTVQTAAATAASRAAKEGFKEQI